MSKKRKPKQRRKAVSERVRKKETHSNAPATDSSSGSSRFGKWILPTVLISVAAVVAFLWLKPESDASLIERVESDFDANQHALVLVSVNELVQRQAASASVLMMGAKSAEETGRPDIAVGLLDSIGDEQGNTAVEARIRSGEIMYDTGYAQRSEAYFRRALELDPDNSRAAQLLANLLNVMGRRFESAEFAFEALKEGRLGLSELVMFSNRRPSTDIGKGIDVFFNATGDPGTNLSRTRALVFSGKSESAIPYLRDILKEDPSNIEAAVFLGMAFQQTDNAPEFSWWHALANAEPENLRLKEHPDYWIVEGDWAFDHGQPTAAARAYWEVLLRDPYSAKANFRLAKLSDDGSVAPPLPTKVTAEMRERSRLVQELEALISKVNSLQFRKPDEKDLGQMRQIVELLEQLNRTWEAHAWAVMLLRMDRRNTWAPGKRDALRSRLTEMTPRYTGPRFPDEKYSLSSLPRLQLNTIPDASRSADPDQAESESDIRFADATDAAGIEFSFFNSPVGKDLALYMYQLMGGGVGVVDFNVDGLPDIYFPQGCQWPIDASQDTFLDRLFMNVGNGFTEITTQAGVKQNGFGQSVTFGDYDSDGFPDVYVANIGGNRLLRNNGDGTFADMTSRSNIDGAGWTCGTVMVDINGDTHPDIYDVNYLGGDDVFTRACADKDRPVSCPPKSFDPTEDRVLINQADGTFADVTGALKIPPGKGLGIVAADINADDKLDLFIGNDGQANFMLLNQSATGSPRFADKASELGLDLDNTGDAQACMGIAVADINSDQQLDLFITNFTNEYNTLYLSDDFGFSDASRTAAVAATGNKFVGFGTQAVDAELDGDEDLLIVNGHVQDFDSPKRPFAMKPQFLENVGQAEFRQRSANDAGRFWDREMVGRGMARLDWNRDGLEEIVVVSLDQPAVLLKNESVPVGGFVSLRLVGTKSSRDAIGAAVILSHAGKQIYRQLVAGDGYAASNQRELVFATMDAATDATMDAAIDSIKIHWPSGQEQTFESVAPNRHYIAVEGRAALVPAN